MIGRVEMRRAMGGEPHPFEAPAFAVRQVFLFQAGKKLENVGGGLPGGRDIRSSGRSRADRRRRRFRAAPKCRSLCAAYPTLLRHARACAGSPASWIVCTIKGVTAKTSGMIRRDMPAYWVARSKVNDPVEYKKYTDQVPAIIAKFGGKVLARGGTFSDHGRSGQIPPLHRDRISHLGAGRGLLHLAGIRQGRGVPAQRRRRGGNHHGGGDLAHFCRPAKPLASARRKPRKMPQNNIETGGLMMLRNLKSRTFAWIAGAALRSRPARCSSCPARRRRTRSRSRSASAWR